MVMLGNDFLKSGAVICCESSVGQERFWLGTLFFWDKMKSLKLRDHYRSWDSDPHRRTGLGFDIYIYNIILYIYYIYMYKRSKLYWTCWHLESRFPHWILVRSSPWSHTVPWCPLFHLGLSEQAPKVRTLGYIKCGITHLVVVPPV